MVDPLKSLRLVIQDVQLRITPVQPVQVAHQIRNSRVLRHGLQLPLHQPLLVPLLRLTQFLSHEEQLLPRMGHQESVSQAQVRKFYASLSRHLLKKSGLSVHHLVMGKRQDVFLTVLVNHAEGQLPVVVAPEIRVIPDVAQVVVHEAHVPLQVKAQPVLFQAARDPGEGRALLRDGEHPGVALLHHGIEVFDHLYGFQVLISAVHVRHPFPVLFSVVQVEHAGHGVHAYAVRMVLLHPEQGVRDQVVGHLGPSVIVNQCPPVGMEALPGVFVLVEAGSVKIGKAVGIPGKMSGNPVQDHPDACLVQLVDKVHEILGRTVPGGGRVIADDLVAPGLVQRVLHHGHQLHVGIAHLLYVGNQPVCDFPVVCKLFPALSDSEGAEVHLVHADGSLRALEIPPVSQESLVLPLKLRQIRYHGSRIRPQLRRIAVRIRLQVGEAPLQLQLELIIVPRLRTRDKDFKDAGIPQPPHLVDAPVPAVEIPHHADAQGVGRPDRKAGSLHLVPRHGVSAQLFVYRIMDAVLELLRVRHRDDRIVPIGFPPLCRDAVLSLHHVTVGGNLLLRHGKQRRKEAVIVRPLHGKGLSGPVEHDFRLPRLRKIRLHQRLVSRPVRA